MAVGFPAFRSGSILCPVKKKLGLIYLLLLSARVTSQNKRHEQENSYKLKRFSTPLDTKPKGTGTQYVIFDI
jgi:hypothetical protein